MDPGATPVDADDIIQRYGRRLFVLAYHLIGDASRAHELAQECLLRSLLEPVFPAGDRETGVHLMRGLISLWRERLEPPARSGRSRDKLASAPSPDSRPGEHADLWRALSRLDPTSRAVLVLRVAGDLEYETIGRIMDMAADVVYARLLQARSRLHPGASAISNPVFETMNLYLDGRLGGPERGEFERLLGSDGSLRSRVEFHRGLTLDLHEEAPPLPRDFAARIHDRLDRTRETLALVDQAVEEAGWEPASALPASAPPGYSPAPPTESDPATPARVDLRPGWGKGAGIAALVFAVAGVTFWIARRLPVSAPAASSSAAASPSATPDEATIEALRSLGYLAPGKKGSKPAADPARRETRPARTPPVAAATPKPPAKPPAAPLLAAPSPAAQPTPAQPTPAQPTPAQPTPAQPAPAQPIAAQPSPAPEAGAAPDGTSARAVVGWRVVQVGRAPEKEGQHRVIRTAAEWVALLDGSGAPVPEVAFDREMVVLLPAVLAVASIQQTGEAVVVECRPARPPSVGEETPAQTSGLAVILPIFDQPVRIVIR